MAWDKDKPAGSQKIRLSDEEIRANQAALETQLGTEHNFPTDGTHTDITCDSISGPEYTLEVTTVPTHGANKGILYTKDVSSKAELFFIDEDGDEVQLTSGGETVSIPAGTKMYFYQNTAPTGWTYESGVTDRLLSVKGGSRSYNINGGNIGGSWTQPSHTLTISEMPSHNHTFLAGKGSNNDWDYVELGYTEYGKNQPTTYVGGGGSHYHGSTYRPSAAVGIICSKD